MNLKALAATALSAAALVVAAPAVEARTVCGNIAGWEGCARDNGYNGVDSILVEALGSVYEVEVNCRTGKFRYDRGLGLHAADRIATAWCRN